MVTMRAVRIIRWHICLPACAQMGQAISKNKAVLYTSGFTGMAVWLIVASLYCPPRAGGEAPLRIP